MSDLVYDLKKQIATLHRQIEDTKELWRNTVKPKKKVTELHSKPMPILHEMSSIELIEYLKRRGKT